MHIYIRLFLLLVLLPAGCAPRQKHVAATGTPTFLPPLPAVFRAHLDIRKCPQTSFELVLRPDGMYYLQMENKVSDNAAVQAEVGVWRYTTEDRTVLLTSYNEVVRLFTLTEKNILKLLEVSGGMMPPLVRYDFTLVKTAPRYEGEVRMQGMYTRKRGRGIFRECLSGVSFPLASGVRIADIERSYQDILHGRDESLLVTLDMRLSTGSGRYNPLIPVHSVALDPYRSCQGKERRIATIADNRWYLTELAGKAVEPESVNKPPFLKVQSGEQLIEGFAGCNHFTGSWLFTYNDFVFSRIRSTRMACPLGMEVEDAFLQALDATRRYTIKGDILSLHDRRGRVLARLHYSRPLTDLDFRYSTCPTFDRNALEEKIFSDSIAAPESHRVEIGGAVPASVVRPPVREVAEKILPLSEKSAHKDSGLHKIREIKAGKRKKKIAADRKTHAAAQPAQTEKKAVPTPKPSASPVVPETQKKQDDNAAVPSPTSGDQGKSVVDVVEKEEGRASAESADKPEPTPHVNPKEELPLSPESFVPAAEKNEQERPVEPGAVSNEVKIPAEQPPGQAEIQTTAEDKNTSALPPIPEKDEGKRKVQPEEPMTQETGEQEVRSEVGEQIPAEDIKPAMPQSEERKNADISPGVSASSAEGSEEE